MRALSIVFSKVLFYQTHVNQCARGRSTLSQRNHSLSNHFSVKCSSKILQVCVGVTESTGKRNKKIQFVNTPFRINSKTNGVS